MDRLQSSLLNENSLKPFSLSANEIKESTLDRIAIIDFLRVSLECDTPWMDTIVLTKLELMTTFAKKENFKRRAKVYNVLGLSLANILDKRHTNFTDFMYAITQVSQENDIFSTKEVLPRASTTSQPRKEKTKKSIFSKTGEEFSVLQIPHFAFQPDYYQVLFTLLDTVHEVHMRIMSFFGNTSAMSKDISSNVLEAYQKFNARIKKHLAIVYKDIEELARSKINRELNRVMSGLITTTDRGAHDRQNNQPGSASFRYFQMTP